MAYDIGKIVEYYDAVKMGLRLKNIRKRKGYTQEKLAEELLLTEDSISNYEHGRTSCMHEHLMRICQLFNISADYFYFGFDKELYPKENADYADIVNTLDGCDNEELSRIRIMINILLAGSGG